MSELGCADGCGREKGGYRIARTAADGVGAREWMEMGGEKKPLVMSELGCADGCGRQMGQNCADGCGRRGCEGVAGNGWGEEAAGDQRRNSPHPFPVRSRPRSQARSSQRLLAHPFPATPLHPRRRQPSAQFSPPICRPQPPAQPSSLIPSGFFSRTISSHSLAHLAPAPSAAVRAILRTYLPSAAVRAATLGCGRRGCKGVGGNGWGDEQDAAHEPECSHVC